MTLDCNPHPISVLDEGRFHRTDSAWWYEENGGVLVVVETHPETIQLHIPWRSIRAALARKES